MLSFIGGIILDLFVFICACRIVRMAFRWTKTAMRKVSDTVDDRIANYGRKEEQTEPKIVVVKGEDVKPKAKGDPIVVDATIE